MTRYIVLPFFLNVEAVYYINYTPNLASRYLGDLSNEIDAVVRSSSSLKKLFEACYPVDFTPSEKAVAWAACQVMLDSYGKMRASDLIKSVRAANRPNGGESVGLRQYVNITSEVSKLKQEEN